MVGLPLGATENCPVWRLRTDNVLHVCNNGSGGDDDDKYSDLGGGCSDGDGEVEDDGNSGNGVGDGSNGGKDDSSDSVTLIIPAAALGISLTFPPFMYVVKTWSHTRAAHVRSTDGNCMIFFLS